MLQRWVDHEGVEHRVLDDYNRNVILCDLTAQPTEIKKIISDKILGTPNKSAGQVGIKFMKFCAKNELNRLSEQAEAYAKILNSSYQGDTQ